MQTRSARLLEMRLCTSGGDEVTVRKGSSPIIDTDRCVNCGTCLRACPTGALREVQRQICRLCPDCARGPVMFPRDMEEMTRVSCASACPLGHYPEGYMNFLARGDWEGAWELISAINPLPGVLGRICGRPCEEECKRGALIDSPLPIRAAKKTVAEWAYRSGRVKKRNYRRNIDMRVAVAGGGPAGLVAACDLASLGYRVTIFEAGPELGGMLRMAVPAFRLPEEVWKREYEAALGEGVEVVYGAAVGTSPSLAELLQDGYRAVVLALGAPRGKRLPIPGSSYRGVHDALSFMCAVKSGRPVEVGEKAVVIGGGSVATDVARTALRKGAREASMVCVEEECALPALSWEIEEAVREGVRLVAGYAPLRITSSWMQAEAVELARVVDVGCDAWGRISPQVDTSCGMTLAADTVIFAVGQGVDSAALERMGIEVTTAGTPACDAASGATSLAGIFAAGDFIGGQGSVVEAMASGRRAARAVDDFLMGKTTQAGERNPGSAPLQEKIFPVRLEKLEPLQAGLIPAAKAVACFEETELPLDPMELETDARRCMRCGYVTVDHTSCLGCGLCREVCPAEDVVTMGSPREGGDGR